MGEMYCTLSFCSLDRNPSSIQEREQDFKFWRAISILSMLYISCVNISFKTFSCVNLASCTAAIIITSGNLAPFSGSPVILHNYNTMHNYDNTVLLLISVQIPESSVVYPDNGVAQRKPAHTWISESSVVYPDNGVAQRKPAHTCINPYR